MKPASPKTETPEPSSTRTIRVCVVEDDPVVREQLVHQLNRAHGFTCVSSHRTAEAALEEIPKHHPDVVLMDINLPRMDGIDCVRQLKAAHPRLQFLMLTVYDDSERIFQSLTAGASGYLLKRTSSRQLLEAVRDVHQGGSPMTSHIARKVVQFFNQQARLAPELEQLSSRELEVLDHLSRGRLYKEIAELLAISLDTVRKHLQSIYNKLHVHSRTEAVVKYLQK